MNEIDYLAIFKESFTLVILMFCSMISVAFALERWWFFRKAEVDGDELLTSVRKLLEAGKADQAQAACIKHPSPIARVIHYGLVNRGHSRVELEELLSTKRAEEKLRMESYLAVLGTMGNTAPFVGLFGTVVGIIKAFRDLAAAGGGGPTVVAKGIAEALVATAGGLAVAIPAVVCYNYFQRRVKTLSVEMEVYSTRLLVMMGSK
ncbi:MAG: biopolymer transport protein ExbB [Elusimicrobia bacterium]|nr:MAG: biopolymer transport protein ExbB [Elusimicrobiota bacterium]